MPRIQALGVNPVTGKVVVSQQTKKDVIDEWLQPTIDEIAAAYSWDFVLDETTHSGGTVKDEPQYTLKGTASNAMEIVTIKYGSDENVLKKMHPIDMDAFLHKRSHSSTDFWVPDGRVNTFPRVRLVATPGEASTQIKYRYRRNNITLSDLPNNFGRVVAMGIARNLDENLDGLYQDALEFMIDNYTATQVNERVVHLDPHLIDLHNWRSRNHGWSG